MIFSESALYLPVDAVHHLETYWPDPHTFNPDRFAPGQNIVPFTYLPFSTGPRVCIGKNFAMMEAKIVIAKLFHTFHFYDPRPEEKTILKTWAVTSKPKNAVLVGIDGI